MADNITIKDASAATVTVATTDLSDVHYPKHTIADDNGYIAGVDSTSGSLQTIMFEHHEIHEGNMFSVSGHTSLGDGVTYGITFTTPNTTTRVHLVGGVGYTQETDVEWYEGSSTSAGSTYSPVCRRRDASKGTASTTVKTGVTISAAGTLLWETRTGARNTAGSVRASGEWVLAANTEYLLKLISGGAANTVAWDIQFYEHTDSN